MPSPRRQTKKTSVRRLFVRDPYNKNSQTGFQGPIPTVSTFSPVADQFTNNPNPLYDPSKGNSNAAREQQPRPPAGSNTGHAKVFKPNRFTLFGGRRIRRF